MQGGDIMNISKTFAVGAFALAMGATAASAQSYNRLVSFGDSLSDNGNLFAVTGSPPAPYNQRFTNALVWSEYLFGPGRIQATTNPANVNTGNINFSYGGARTDLAPNSNGPIPSTGTQIGAFLLNGGRFGANDLVSLWGGANNLFQGIPVAAGNPATATTVMAGVAAASAADIGNQVRQLSGAGARTIVVFNLPSFDQTPQFAGGPAQALSGFSSASFNGALFTQLQNSGGANVILIPVDQIFAAVLANPTGFGLSNVTQQCIQVLACVGNPAARGSFLFWDGVHPTVTGHRIIEAAVREYLIAPSRAASVNAAFGNRRSTAIDGLSQLSMLPVPADAWRYFVYATGEAGQFGATQTGATYGAVAQPGVGGKVDFKQAGLRFGGLRGIGNGWTVGLMASVLRGDIDSAAGKFEATNMQFGLDLLARWRSQTGSFVNLGLGASVDSFSKYEYRTIGPLKNTGSAQAVSWSAAAEVGHDFAVGQMTVTPQGRLTYISSTLDRFNEAGVVAPIAFGERKVGAFGGAAEVKFAYNFTPASSVYVLAGYETLFGKSDQNVTGQLIGNTAQPFSWRAEAPRAPGLVAGAGLAVNFGAVTARASYRGTFGEKDTRRHSFNLGVDAKF
jgi:outer membrane lipase/esterase